MRVFVEIFTHILSKIKLNGGILRELKGAMSRDFAVLGQFCAKSITYSGA